jgi:hypothetical protein
MADTPSAQWSEQSFRAGLEIGIRAAHAVWYRAMNERHFALAQMRAETEIAALLEPLAANFGRAPSKPRKAEDATDG